MRIKAWTTTVLMAALAAGCGTGGAPAGNADPTANGAGGPSGGGTVGTHEGAIVRVDLRGLDSLSFADGTRIALERFVVHLGEVSLLRDLSDPAAARLDLEDTRLPVIFGPGETSVDRFIIGRESLRAGAFKGIRLELAPGTTSTSPDDGSDSTIFVQGVFTMPTILDEKSDGQKISPNPAPIEPHSAATQPLTSVQRLPFRFQSKRVEDLLVGLSADLAAGKTLILVFRANYWFTEAIRSFLVSEARTRMRLGVPPEFELRIVGQGFESENETIANVGLELESNILDNIGIEVR